MADREQEKLKAAADLKAKKEELAALDAKSNVDARERNKLVEKLVELEKILEEAAEDRIIRLQKEVDLAADKIKYAQAIADLDGDRSEIQLVLIAQSEAQVALGEEELDQLMKKGLLIKDKSSQEFKDHQRDLTAALAKNEVNKETLDLQKDQQKAVEEIGDKIAGTLGGMVGMTQASESLVGQLFMASGATGDMGKALSNIGKSLKATFSPANVMYNLMEKVGEATMAAFISTDQFRADLAKAGASLDQYGGMMQDVSAETQTAGVYMKDAQQAILGLHSGMAGFNTMAKADQQTLVATTAVMSKLGVDAATSAGNLNILTKSMGMNAKEANIATKEIAATAQALGVGQEKMAADFAAAAPQLSAHGSAGVQVFRELATQAKATGIEMGTLLSIAGQFDTFEGSAEAAGKLNAVLGTQINSIDLLTATEDERIKMLRDSVDASGKSWESMNKFEKQMVASAAGISDVNEAGKLFGTTAREMENAANAAEKMALADKELQAQAANASTAKEKLLLIAERFGVVMIPLIDTVHWLLDGLLALNQHLGGYFIPTMMTMVGIWWLSTAATKRATLAKKADIEMALVQHAAREAGILTASGELVATETQTAATNKGILAKIKDRIATAARTVVAGIATAAGWAWIAMKGAYNAITNAGILLTLRETATKIASWAWDKVIIVWEGLKALARWAGFNATVASTSAEAASIPVRIASTSATSAAIGPTLAFGAAMLMVGGGIFLAAYGISLFVKSFATLPPGMIWGVVAALGVFAVTMIAIALIMSTLGAAAVGPMLAFGAAFLMIGAGVMLAALGMAKFVEAFSGLDPAQISGVVGGMAMFALTMAQLALIMMLAGPAMVTPMLAFGAAFLMIGAGVGIVALSMPIIVGALERLSQIGASLTQAALGMSLLVLAFVGLASLSLFLLPVVTVISVLTGGILALALALSLIKTDDLRSVADMAHGIGSITVESATAFDNAMIHTKEAVVAIAKEPKAAKLLASTANTFSAQKVGAVGAAGAAGAGGAGGAAGATPAGERTIILKLDKREFGRAVINIFEKEQDLNRVK